MRLMLLLLSVAPLSALDLAKAVIVAPPELSPVEKGALSMEKRAVSMLIEEVEKRTQIRWQTSGARPSGSAPSIAIGNAASLKAELPGDRAAGPEGYTILASGSRVIVAGNDSRGVLFGAGRLLRALRMSQGSVTIPDRSQVSSAPKYGLRGHQLGYRPKTNSYDGWSVPMWEQYIRDLTVFGANAVELIPPRSDDDADSPHFPLPPMRMMIEMSRILDEYGLDVWIWYPAMDKDYSDPQTVESALREWGEVFRQLPRVDAIFVPGGDPGHTQPKHLMALLEKQTQVLRRYHPKAQMWVSPQGFSQAWLDEFLNILRHEQPPWLSGVVFGPQTRISLPRLREAVPKRYPIPALSRYHAQPAVPIPRSGLGPGLRGYRRPRGDQPAA